MMKEFSNVKAVLFDMDGTLIDTEKIYQDAWVSAIHDMGYEMQVEQYYELRSLGRPFAPALLKEWYGTDFDYDRVRKLRTGYFNAWVDAHGIERKPGVIELVETLHKKGILTAIVTATDPERAERFLKMTGLSGYFDRVISATMVTEGKPSPQVYQYACRELGFQPAECAAVEDAPNGIRSAYRAGCKVIMVPDLTQPNAELKQMLDYCADSLNDLCDIFA